MQYDKEKFNDYVRNYLDIKKRIASTKKEIYKLLENEKLNKTIDFYNSLYSDQQDIFNHINCNMDFISYKLKKKIISELEKSLNTLYKEFSESEVFPFSKDEFHFFVSSDTYLVDAITNIDSKKFNEEENIFLRDIITSIDGYNPNDYTNDDITLIKVLYLNNKDHYKKKTTLINVIKTDIRLIRNTNGKILKMMKR